jgi:hypothetical protein
MLIRLGNPGGHLVLFGLILGIGLVLGIAAYALLAHPGSRRRQFRDRPAVPRRWAAVAGLGIAGALGGIAWWVSFADFFAVEAAPEGLRLLYRFPDREVRLRREEVARFQEALTEGGIDRRRLVVLGTDGRRRRSAAVPAPELRAAIEALERWRTGGGPGGL